MSNSFSRHFQTKPLVVSLCEFTEHEQELIFNNYYPNEKFAKFHREIKSFDLDVLLSNPMQLKLFADAYIESGRQFESKNSIYSQAINRLAKEHNESVSLPEIQLSVEEKVQFASEVFAKLLLSGAEGVTKSEANTNNLYPVLVSLVRCKKQITNILATQLFKGSVAKISLGQVMAVFH